MPTASQFLLDLVPEATLALLAAYGVALRAVETRSGTPAGAQMLDVVGSISFAGRRINGRLFVGMPFELAARTRPTSGALSRGRSADWLLVRDWCGELANQLLGRVKNRLFPYGLVVDTFPPTALSGDALRVAFPRQGRRFVFQADAHEVHVWLDAKVQPDDPLPARSDERGPREGEVLLF
jgi:hypothetical protein